MRLIQRLSLLWALLLATALSSTAAAADDTVSVRGILVSASREAGETDKSLAPYEANLRRRGLCPHRNRRIKILADK